MNKRAVAWEKLFPHCDSSFVVHMCANHPQVLAKEYTRHTIYNKNLAVQSPLRKERFMNEKYYVPVEITKTDLGEGTAYVNYKDYQGHTGLIKLDALESSKTLGMSMMEDYVKALRAACRCNNTERKAIWGTDDYHHIIMDMDPSDVISKWEAYDNIPKFGDVWKHNRSNYVVIVLEIQNDVVTYCGTDMERHQAILQDFLRSYQKTDDDVVEALSIFLKEVEKLKDKYRA